jgi:hypothetical protein
LSLTGPTASTSHAGAGPRAEVRRAEPGGCRRRGHAGAARRDAPRRRDEARRGPGVHRPAAR